MIQTCGGTFFSSTVTGAFWPNAFTNTTSDWAVTDLVIPVTTHSFSISRAGFNIPSNTDQHHCSDKAKWRIRTILHNELHWLSVPQRIKSKLGNMMFR